MNLKSLEYFLAVAKYNSFSKAAKHLFVTQPTLSRHVAELEKELKTELFIRESKKVVLTESGKICYEEAEKIKNLADNIVNKINDSENNKKLKLNIGYLTSIQSTINNQIIEFCNKYKDIDINMIGCYNDRVKQLFEYKEIDILATVAGAVEGIHNIKKFKICKNELLVMVSKDHPLAKKNTITISELKNQEIIALNQQISSKKINYLLDENNKLGFKLNIKNYVNDMFTLILLVSSGKGISFISTESLAVLNGIKAIKLLPIEDANIDADIIFAYNANNKNPAIKIFTEEMKRIFKTENGN